MAVILGSLAQDAIDVGGNTTPVTVPVTTVAADTRLLVLVGKAVGGSPPTGVTYNGAALTADGNFNGGFNISVWHIDNFTPGSFNVVVSIAATQCNVIAIPLQGADTTRAPSLGVATNATTTTPTCTAPAAGAGDLQIAQCMTQGATLTSAGAPQANVPANPALPTLYFNSLYSHTACYLTLGSNGVFSWTTANGIGNAQGVTIFAAPVVTAPSVSALNPANLGPGVSPYNNNAFLSSPRGFTQIVTAATPTFSPVAGTYISVQSVTISTTTPGATIYYTIDGSTPTTASTIYSGPITVGVSETVQAIATAQGYSQSAVGSAAYTINLPFVPLTSFYPTASLFATLGLR